MNYKTPRLSTQERLWQESDQEEFNERKEHQDNKLYDCFTGYGWTIEDYEVSEEIVWNSVIAFFEDDWEAKEDAEYFLYECEEYFEYDNGLFNKKDLKKLKQVLNEEEIEFYGLKKI